MLSALEEDALVLLYLLALSLLLRPLRALGKGRELLNRVKKVVGIKCNKN